MHVYKEIAVYIHALETVSVTDSGIIQSTV